MAPFPSYAVPNEIRDIVRRKPNAPDFMNYILTLGSAKARKNPETYHLSFKTKLFLEEEEDLVQKFDQYNKNNIRIEHFSGDKFRFKIDVSI